MQDLINIWGSLMEVTGRGGGGAKCKKNLVVFSRACMEERKVSSK